MDKDKSLQDTNVTQVEQLDLDQQLLDKSELIQHLNEESNMKNRKVYQTKGTDILLSNAELIYSSIVKGDTIEKICSKLGIPRTTWYYVKNNSKYFNKLIEFAKQEQIENVKCNLVSKTQDKYVTAEKVLPNGRVVEYQKFLPSDFNAIKFYLLNKAGDEFKERQEVTVKKTDIIVDIIEDAVDVEFTEVEKNMD